MKNNALAASIYIFIKPLNQFPFIKAQTSDEIQPLEDYENSTDCFDDMLLSKQASKINLFFIRGCQKTIDIYYVSQSSFHLPKKLLKLILK